MFPGIDPETRSVFQTEPTNGSAFRRVQRAPVFDGITRIPLTNVPGALFRTNLPSDNNKIIERVNHFKELGIHKVVVLVQAHEYLGQHINIIKLYNQNNLKVIHFEIKDFSTPNTRDLNRVVNRIYKDLKAGKNVVVHCRGGLGRTGMVLATLVSRVLGKPAEEALGFVRQYVPGAVETSDQERCISQACKEESEESAGALEDGDLMELLAIDEFEDYYDSGYDSDPSSEEDETSPLTKRQRTMPPGEP